MLLLLFLLFLQSRFGACFLLLVTVNALEFYPKHFPFCASSSAAFWYRRRLEEALSKSLKLHRLPQALDRFLGRVVSNHSTLQTTIVHFHGSHRKCRQAPSHLPL